MSRFIIALFVISSHVLVHAQEIDKELSVLAEKLAAPIKEHGKKKVTVLDFTDLQGGSTELGKYIAEQLTVNLVLEKREFSVLDRANLKSILAEHKLTAKGLIDPENAKKLGQFAGVDALILGTIISRNQNISLTAKIITTDTAEIVGAARAEFKADETVKQLESRPATDLATRNGLEQKKEETGVTKSFGSLRVEVQPLQIVNGSEYVLTLLVSNQNPKKSIWVALNTGGGFPAGLKASFADPEGNEFQPDMNSISGIALSAFDQGSIFQATEIGPDSSISPTIKFFSRQRRKATPGSCRLQLELACDDQSVPNQTGTARLQNFVTKIEAK